MKHPFLFFQTQEFHHQQKHIGLKAALLLKPFRKLPGRLCRHQLKKQVDFALNIVGKIKDNNNTNTFYRTKANSLYLHPKF